ncbi:MAG: hypothetical protein AB7I19_10540 [Planctomycetota bacterium]
MNRILATCAVVSTLLFAGCGEKPQENRTPSGDAKTGAPANQDAGASTPAANPAGTTVIATPHVHDAICGHTLEGVGHCGNYVKIDDKWVEILWPQLGVMEWCKDGKKGARVEITGEMRDGKFVASSYRRVE